MKPLPTIIIAMMLLMSMPVIAQDDPGDDPDAPIDGGITILVAAAIGYGVKKAHGMKRNDHINRENRS